MSKIEISQTCIEYEFKDKPKSEVYSVVDGVGKKQSCNDRLNSFRINEASKIFAPTYNDSFVESSVVCERMLGFVAVPVEGASKDSKREFYTAYIDTCSGIPSNEYLQSLRNGFRSTLNNSDSKPEERVKAQESTSSGERQYECWMD